ncbi:DSBA-like thioredoxin domain-containing protein [Xylariaceae sp. FL1272]|nr:DSBA-like thioredoxin domain-containing protein [Xylariaceae sp. FL1272]
MTHFNIKIVSDTVCPWCYVGKKRLDRAIELYRKSSPAARDDTFTISWAPFYLDPTAPKVGVPLMERMAEKFGPGRLEMMQQRLLMIGKEEGINFAFSSRTGNTRDSHRLIQLAKTKGNDVENRVVTELFKSYFEGAGDITSTETLVTAAERAGLSTTEVKDWLSTGKGGPEVDKEVQEAYAKNIHGVPNFTIQGHDVGGAQEPETFLEIFSQIKESTK